jgi:hypothetical protein
LEHGESLRLSQPLPMGLNRARLYLGALSVKDDNRQRGPLQKNKRQVLPTSSTGLNRLE